MAVAFGRFIANIRKFSECFAGRYNTCLSDHLRVRKEVFPRKIHGALKGTRISGSRNPRLSIWD